MNINIPHHLLNEIHTQGENAYPEEGAGLLLGYEQDGVRYVQSLLTLENASFRKTLMCGARINITLRTKELIRSWK